MQQSYNYSLIATFIILTITSPKYTLNNNVRIFNKEVIIGKSMYYNHAQFNIQQLTQIIY